MGAISIGLKLDLLFAHRDSGSLTDPGKSLPYACKNEYNSARDQGVDLMLSKKLPQRPIVFKGIAAYATNASPRGR